MTVKYRAPKTPVIISGNGNSSSHVFDRIVTKRPSRIGKKNYKWSYEERAIVDSIYMVFNLEAVKCDKHVRAREYFLELYPEIANKIIKFYVDNNGCKPNLRNLIGQRRHKSVYEREQMKFSDKIGDAVSETKRRFSILQGDNS